ncbi:MAG TPA: hypothetical protein P5181_05055 [Dermatophilaceae bacterium]|mgnify:CR=1 FL=1|nr:hypothetical protein [Dermatophilaceae bacterium]
MSHRLLALVAGAAAGVAVVLVVRALSGSDDLRATLTGLATDIREGMAQREDELRVALGLDAPPPGLRLDPRATRDLLDDPAGWRAR